MKGGVISAAAPPGGAQPYCIETRGLSYRKNSRPGGLSYRSPFFTVAGACHRNVERFMKHPHYNIRLQPHREMDRWLHLSICPCLPLTQPLV